jgi:hypothetical protein
MLATPGGTPRRRRLLPVLVASVVLAGCSGGVPPAVPPSLPPSVGGSPAGAPGGGRPGADVDDADVAGFGVDLDLALRSGDVEQWLALFALTDGDELQRQRDWYAAVHAVPMDIREMHVAAVQQHGSTTGFGPRVDLAFRHQVTGADPEPAVEQYRVRLGRQDGRVRIVEVGNVRSVETGYPQPWDLTRVEVLERGAVVVIAQEELREEAEELLPALDLAATTVLEEFPVAGVSRMVVSLTTPEVFEDVVDATGSEFAGISQVLPTVADVEPGGAGGLPPLVDGDGLAVRLQLNGEYAYSEWEYYADDLAHGSPLLRHEGVHLALTLAEPWAAPPSWAAEGFAGWYEVAADEVLREEHLWWLGDLSRDGVAETLPPRLPLTFYADDAEELTRNYVESAAVFLYVEDAFGWDTTIDLGVALNAVEWPTDDLEEVLRQHLDLTPEEFEQGYLDWLAGRLD